MPDWRAVGVGVVTTFLLGVFSVAVPVLGQLIALVVGGGVAGYLAGGRFRRGAWYGLVAVALAPVFAALVVFVVVVVVFAVGVAVDSAAVAMLAYQLAGFGAFVLALAPAAAAALAEWVVVVLLLLAGLAAVGGGVGARRTATLAANTTLATCGQFLTEFRDVDVLHRE